MYVCVFFIIIVLFSIIIDDCFDCTNCDYGPGSRFSHGHDYVRRGPGGGHFGRRVRHQHRRSHVSAVAAAAAVVHNPHASACDGGTCWWLQLLPERLQQPSFDRPSTETRPLTGRMAVCRCKRWVPALRVTRSVPRRPRRSQHCSQHRGSASDSQNWTSAVCHNSAADRQDGGPRRARAEVRCSLGWIRIMSG